MAAMVTVFFLFLVHLLCIFKIWQMKIFLPRFFENLFKSWPVMLTLEEPKIKMLNKTIKLIETQENKRDRLIFPWKFHSVTWLDDILEWKQNINPILSTILRLSSFLEKKIIKNRRVASREHPVDMMTIDKLSLFSPLSCAKLRRTKKRVVKMFPFEKEIFIIFLFPFLQISNWNDFAIQFPYIRRWKKGYKTCFEYLSFYAGRMERLSTFTHFFVL